MQNKNIILNLFGTDGIRAEFGKSPLTPENITKLGYAIGQWAQEKYGKEPVLLIGHDTRISCQEIKTKLALGLLAHNINIYDAQIVPTPAVVKLVTNNKNRKNNKNKKDKNFNFGIIITASHNPYQDNGIKIVDAQDGKLNKIDEDKITKNFNQKFYNLSKYKNIQKNHIPFEQAQEQYIKIITHYFKPNFLQNIKIVLDCAHGATYNIAPKIFKALGAEIITIANTPNGKNINHNCGSLHPEQLKETVVKEKADIGFAFDGDGDRLTIVTKNGHPKYGDEILCLLHNHPNYKKQETLIGTIMTNYGIEKYLENKNQKLFRTNVGDKFVAKEMKNKNILLGGEPSGHVLLGDYLYCSDGIFAALKCLETILETQNWNVNTFEKIPQITINVPVKEKKDLNSPDLNKIILEYKSKIKNGRIIVRYSGTQNMLRVMVEEQDDSLAKQICQNLAKELKKILDNK